MPVTLPSPSPPPAPQIFPLISQSRWLVKSGELTDLEFSVSPGLRRKLNTRPVHLHLFNDCLLLSRPRESVTGAGGRSTGGRGEWERPQKGTKRDREGLCCWRNPSPWPSLRSPGHSRERKNIQNKRGNPTKDVTSSHSKTSTMLQTQSKA